eukprot:GEMP01005072.1.p1 GENE.GEMP01005072.1~~GEMP01005072.1.p1  ORF type:complete len:564 (+),score=175.35 GEMP01005072.1:192-1883(+)
MTDSTDVDEKKSDEFADAVEDDLHDLAEEPVAVAENPLLSAWENEAFGRCGMLCARQALLDKGILQPDTSSDRMRMLHMKRATGPAPLLKKQNMWNRPLRTVEGLGTTERAWMGDNGAVWKVLTSKEFESVVVRKNIDMRSDIVREAKQGEELTQKGWAELFVDGQAKGLVRMPVLPDGWVTVDAQKVGGPTYLEMVKEAPEQPPKRTPKEKERDRIERQRTEQVKVDEDAVKDLQTRMWEVIFQSGAEKGDIIVRAQPNLMSEEVHYLFCGDLVEQNGEIKTPPEGVPRMPIRTQSGHEGWVTLDASAKGGPQFFDKCKDVEKARKWYEDRLRILAEKAWKPREAKEKENDGGGWGWKDGTDAWQDNKNEWRERSDWKDRSDSWKDNDPWKQGDWYSQKWWGQQNDWNYDNGGGKGGDVDARRRKARDDSADDKNEDQRNEERRERREKGDRKERKHQRNTPEWNKTRIWKVISSEPIAVVPDSDVALPPGKRHEQAIGYLETSGTVVEQTGHSKKLKHYMVMPMTCYDPPLVGWVTRRQIGGDAFFQEVQDVKDDVEDSTP